MSPAEQAFRREFLANVELFNGDMARALAHTYNTSKANRETWEKVLRPGSMDMAAEYAKDRS